MDYAHKLSSRWPCPRIPSFIIAAGLVLACSHDEQSDMLGPSPAMTTASTGPCAGISYSRLVPVSTAAQLTNAIYYARQGDLIQLAAGTYKGRWNLKVSGSANSRISVCGPRSAVLDGGGTGYGPIALAARANNWTIQGFTIRNAFQGLFLIGAHGVTVKGLEIYNIGQEAIHLHSFSTHNVIDGNYIHDTGKNAARYGEGIYIGNASSKWCTYYNCKPDKTDSNQVLRNVLGPNIGAQLVDMKEGTTGTIITGNTFNGAGGSSYQDAWVNVYGNRSTVSGNTGTTARVNGTKVQTVASGWGTYNVFHSNKYNLGGGSGYGFLIGGGAPASTSALGCDNTVVNADDGFANVKCK